jgi:hypothetical protein
VTITFATSHSPRAASVASASGASAGATRVPVTVPTSASVVVSAKPHARFAEQHPSLSAGRHRDPDRERTSHRRGGSSSGGSGGANVGKAGRSSQAAEDGSLAPPPMPLSSADKAVENMKKRSNKQLMRNAIIYTCLAGDACHLWVVVSFGCAGSTSCWLARPVKALSNFVCARATFRIALAKRNPLSFALSFFFYLSHPLPHPHSPKFTVIPAPF